jgi:hypothetical protein
MMESSKPVATLAFPALATELKLHIFEFVRAKSDQGNARLVNKVREYRLNEAIVMLTGSRNGTA